MCIHILVYIYIYTCSKRIWKHQPNNGIITTNLPEKKSETRSKAARHGDGIQINVYIYTHKHVKCMYMYRYIYINNINNLVGYITSSMIRLCTQRWERYRRTLTISGFIWVCVMHFFVQSTKSQRSKSPSN